MSPLKRVRDRTDRTHMLRRLLSKLQRKREVLVVVQTTRGQVTVPAEHLRDRLNPR